MSDSTPPNFRSDNIGTVHPDILRALAEANHGVAAPYGADETSAALDRKFSDFFETEARVFPVSTGTVANALALACRARPYGGIYCHEEAHIHTSEGGATEAYTGGAKLITLPGVNYKLTPAGLAGALRRAERGARHRPQPDAVSITQASEYGTVYSLDDIAAIGEIARGENITFHMDGARFANALAALGTSPAEMTWRRGVDILSFGCTKNGGMFADAIVVFDRNLIEPLSFRLRGAGQAWSKMRFAAAQLMAYIDNGLYLKLAAHANALAARLSSGLAALPGVELVAPVQANLVFARLPPRVIEKLAAAGANFGRRGDDVIRLVTRFDGDQNEVDRMIALMRSATA
jgi:threonine aldolase